MFATCNPHNFSMATLDGMCLLQSSHFFKVTSNVMMPGAGSANDCASIWHMPLGLQLQV